MNHATEEHRLHTLECRMLAEPAALERLCQVIRVRGFRVHQISASAQGPCLFVRMTLGGCRSIDMLRTQLEKLQAVESVLVQGDNTAGCGPATPDGPSGPDSPCGRRSTSNQRELAEKSVLGSTD